MINVAIVGNNLPLNDGSLNHRARCRARTALLLEDLDALSYDWRGGPRPALLDNADSLTAGLPDLLDLSDAHLFVDSLDSPWRWAEAPGPDDTHANSHSWARRSSAGALAFKSLDISLSNHKSASGRGPLSLLPHKVGHTVILDTNFHIVVIFADGRAPAGLTRGFSVVFQG